MAGGGSCEQRGQVLRPKKSFADLMKPKMKKFFNKKGPEVASETAPPQPPLLSPGLKKSDTSRWKKNKKRVEVKPEFDLSTALPATDDFRTSLIMPNLSARFSMLREQDDPNSLLGKASDDSVLQPRRKSRMMDYGFSGPGLSDIAEVSSLHGSIRPPFAFGRQGSMASEDGYSSDADASASVMARARPGEGNTMFGGRQKIYKIATSGANSTRSLGKAVYEDDIGMSAFQRYRQRERNESSFGRTSDDSPGFDFGLDNTTAGAEYDDFHPHNDSAKDLTHSPSLSSYDKKRSTTSSTARSEARSSTAATSVASQPVTGNTSSPGPGQMAHTPASASHGGLERSNTKTRRLYEQGLEQNMYEQQTSALSRLNSLHRQRTLTNGKHAPPLHSVKSTGNLHDRNPQPVYALRAQSPSPMASPLPPLTTFGSVRKPSSNSASPLPSGPHSPLEAQYDEANPLTRSIEPGDRGKATAMGAFNMPKQSFDEDQYLERQKQLQRSNSNAAIKTKASQSALQQRIGRFEQDRQRSASAASSRARSKSNGPKNREPLNGYTTSAADEPLPGNNPASASAGLPTTRQDTHRTFFGNISASDSEDDDDESRGFQQPDYSYGMYHGKWQPSVLPSVSEHPALRTQKSKATLAEEDEDLEPKPLRTAASSTALRTEGTQNASAGHNVDSPTVPFTLQPLSGMVHHLRSKSNQSSIYPGDELPPQDDVPAMPEVPWNRKPSNSFHRGMNNTIDTQSKHDSSIAGSNPWDLEDDMGNRSASRASTSPIDNTTRSGSRANGEFQRQSETSLGHDTDVASWQHELRKQHNRDASTATQQERDAFASELAARRQAIQENMRNMVERQERSRENSPAPSSSGPFKAFGILRAKSSRESFVNVPNAPPKALRMLGAQPNHSAMSVQSERKNSLGDVTRSRGNSSPRVPYGNHHPALNSMPSWDSRPRGDSNGGQHPGERTLASAVASRARSRSNSANTTGRSRSRTGPYRDDLDKAMVEGVGSSASGHADLSPLLTRELTPRASPEIGNSPFGMATDDSTGSRAAMTNYFDQKNLIPIHTASNGRLTPVSPAPGAISPNVFNAARPAPIANPYSHNATPPLSSASTPLTSPAMPPVHTGPRPVGAGLRKKTISKSDISEPTLVSATSNIDTVDLPEGASLRNGMDDIAPPIPPINPKRRGTRGKLFGLGRSDSHEEAMSSMPSSARATPDPFMHSNGSSVYQANPTARMMHRSESEQSGGAVQPQHYGFGSTTGSPERIERSSPPRSAVGLDGGMF